MSVGGHAGEGIARATALDPSCYLGSGSLERDMEQVFARSWQLVAREQQLRNPGDHVVASVARVPVLVVTGPDGRLRAFANVCRHRAGPLATCDGRAARALVCRYHGWTYDLAGRLRHAPEMDDAAGFRPEEIYLPEFRVASWQGFVFVSLGHEAPPLGEVLSGIAERMTAIELAAMEFAHRDRYDLDCDWKVYVDNYLEGYHLPCVHPGLNAVLDYRSYRTELFPWHSLQHAPISADGHCYGSGDAFYWFVHPNLMLNVLPGRLQVNRVLPRGAGRCTVEFAYFYAPGQETRLAGDRDFSDAVQQEDIAICEAVQRGLESGHYAAGRLNPRRESGVWHFHALLRSAYAAAAAGNG